MAIFAAVLLLVIFGIGALFKGEHRPPLNLTGLAFFGALFFLLSRLLIRLGLSGALIAGGLSLILWILRSIRE